MKILKRVPPKRRRKGLTDYRKRLKLVKSGLPRIVIRKTNRYIIAQVINSRSGGDETLITVTSRKLAAYGWRASFKNTSAAYLTGLIAGLLARKKGVEKAVADIGLHTTSVGSKVFAVVKGFLDAGVVVPSSEEVFPDEGRIQGAHIMEYYKAIREGGAITTQFSKSDEDVYMNLNSHFSRVKEKILEEVNGG
ncbi:MAG: 50S ribosomal protein L18 [Nitrososphaeria archaeon]|nr:50S ribosomal protein L18 [Nitrososphaeria archaeon]